MEELLQLRGYLEAGRLPEALELLAYMEEMGLKAVQTTIDSYLQRLMEHLIKQHAQNDFSTLR